MDNNVVIIALGNHTQKKLIPALNNLKIPITAIVTNNNKKINGVNIVSNIESLKGSKNSKFIISHKPNNHFEIIKKLLSKKTSILVEKPAFVSIKDLNEFVNISKDLDLTESMMYRFGEAFKNLESFYIDNMNFIKEINIKFMLPILYKDIKNNFRVNANNIVYEIGCYLYDLIWSLGLMPINIEIEKTSFFNMGILKNIKGNIVVKSKNLNFNLNFMFGYGSKYENCVEIKSINKIFKIDPFFWGREGIINYSLKTEKNEKENNFLQKNLYEKIIYAWINGKELSIIKDLKSLERYNFIIVKKVLF